MYRLHRPEWRLLLIAILVGTLFSLYPASSAFARQDKREKGNHSQNQKDNQKQFDRSGDHKQFDRQGDHQRFDHQGDNKNFDRRQYAQNRDDNRWRSDRQGNHTWNNQDDNRWRNDGQGNHTWYNSRNDDRSRHDGNRTWSKYRDNDYRYYRDGRWYRYQDDSRFRRPQTQVVYVFVPQHRERMREYFLAHRSDLPRYYYDDYYDELPYDVQRNLVVNGYFPEYLEDRLYPFPYELDRYLGPAPYGTRRVMFGRDAYLLQNGSNLILDIIQDLAGR